MFTFTLFSSVKLTGSKNFYLNFTPKWNDYKPFTSSSYTVKDSFDFAKYITQKSSKLLESLFTNVPLNETIEICVNELFKSNQTVSVLKKQQVSDMFC